MRTRRANHVDIDVAEPAFLPEFVTYAQNFEDVMLRRALSDIEKGYYIDIGAFLPRIDNVTFWFYENGWSGINIEPNARIFVKLAEARPRDVNLQMLIAAKPGVATLYLYDGSPTVQEDYVGLATVHQDVAEMHRQNGIDMSATAQVPAITLDQLFAEHAQSRTVDFLKLDVEGSEAEILNSTSFDRTRPRILVVEATRPMMQEPTWHQWERDLRKRGYIKVWFDGLNRFYLREEDQWRRKFFKTPPNVFDNFRLPLDDRRIKFADGQSWQALSAALDAGQREHSSLAADAHALERHSAAARADVARLTAEADRSVALIGHLEQALSTALDKLWKLNGELNQALGRSVDAANENSRLKDKHRLVISQLESELEAARRERDALAEDKVRTALELREAHSRHSRLVDDRQQAISRLEGELAAARRERDASAGEVREARNQSSRLVAEHQQAISRLETELDAARRDSPELAAERDRLIVEIGRHKIKQRAHAALLAERDRLATDDAQWFKAAVAPAYRRDEAAKPVVLKLSLTASGARLKWSISRARRERDIRASLALAKRFSGERQWPLAARYFGDVLEQWPDNADIWVQFGHAVKESGRVAEAEAAYRRALELSPLIADTHLQLGHALKLQGRTQKAIEAYAEALRLDPQLQHTADELLAVGWTSGDVEKAKSSGRVPVQARERSG